MTRDELAAAIDTAHSRGALIRGHIANKEAILMAVELGMDILDHADEMDDECIEKIVAAGTYVVPSLYFPKHFSETMGAGLGFGEAMKKDLEYSYEVLPKANAAGREAPRRRRLRRGRVPARHVRRRAVAVRRHRRHRAARRAALGDRQRCRRDGSRQRARAQCARATSPTSSWSTVIRRPTSVCSPIPRTSRSSREATSSPGSFRSDGNTR